MALTDTSAHLTLKSLSNTYKTQRIAEFFEQDNQRAEDFSLELEELFIDYSKQALDKTVLAALFELAEQSNLKAKIEDLFSGKPINVTEGRSVSHTALRRHENALPAKHSLDKEIAEVKGQMSEFVERFVAKQMLGFSGKTLDTVVSIGIGGSYLGPKLICEALEPYQGDVQVHFIANVDGADAHRILQQVDPERTLFIVQSKSFSTQETLTNAKTARRWFLESTGVSEKAVAKHFIAVSSRPDKAIEFGIEANHVFPMWDSIGGRYSLWSAIGLPIALCVGWDNFEALLEGAESMDQHFYTQAFEQNAPVLLGLIGVWNQNYLGSHSQALVPYDEYLRSLPEYMQQLDMESNGKCVTLSGHPVESSTGKLVWGTSGTNGQHAYFQLLHQGTERIPADFIAAKTPNHPFVDQHKLLLANCLAQSQAMMEGKSLDIARAEFEAMGHDQEAAEALAPHKVIPGNRPSTTILLEQLNPRSLGALIALYEHKIFVQGVIWDINSFDQWGVELGKVLANNILDAWDAEEVPASLDASTRCLIERLKQS